MTVAPPAPRDVLELLKPITWFPPIWAFLCGVVASGTARADRWALVLAGAVLVGPMVCGTSQAINDWFDRHVDAINEPDRPIPSGRIAGHWGLWIALAGSALSLGFGMAMGAIVGWATLLALAFAWAYSAPPIRLKMSGLWGPGAVAITYEGLTWFTGAALMLGGWPSARNLAVLALYSFGAHGIMTLNDFKAIEGDKAMGIRSLPAMLGVRLAAIIACVTMAVPQLVVIGLLVAWGHPVSAAIIVALLATQLVLMRRLLRDPCQYAPWYNATGTSLSVLGMMVSAVALGWSGQG